LGLGAAVLLLTNGASGMHLFTADQDRLSRAGRCLSNQAETWADRELYLPASASSTLVTTGAGDAATAGLLYGILSGTGAEEAAVIASRAAALKVAGTSDLCATRSRHRAAEAMGARLPQVEQCRLSRDSPIYLIRWSTSQGVRSCALT